MTLATILSRHRLSLSPFFILATVCVISNLVAFTLSFRMPAGYVELDPLVQPGLIVSLVKTEGIALIATLALWVGVKHPSERIIFQSLVAGFFAADAVSDGVLFATASQLLATEIAWLAAASMPVAAGLLLLRREKALRMKGQGQPIP